MTGEERSLKVGQRTVRASGAFLVNLCKQGVTTKVVGGLPDDAKLLDFLKLGGES